MLSKPARAILGGAGLLLSLPAQASQTSWEVERNGSEWTIRFDTGDQARTPSTQDALVRLERGELTDEVAASWDARLIRTIGREGRYGVVRSHHDEDGAALAERLLLRGVEAFPDVRFRMSRASSPPNDPEYDSQWFWDKLAMPDAWALSQGDAQVTVVVVDNGCDSTHPDLATKLDEGLDLVDDDDDPSPDASPGAEHGTACAGLIGADSDNGIGVAGACPLCRVRCVRLLSDTEDQPLSDSVAAFTFAKDVGAGIVSNSWGFVESFPVPFILKKAIVEAVEEGRDGLGAVVVFAAGNDDKPIQDYELQAIEEVLTVGAINNFDEATPFTNSGAALDLVSYTGTFTTDISGPAGASEGDYDALFGGTSSACPIVAGVAGLVMGTRPTLTATEVRALLMDNLTPAPYAAPDQDGHDLLYGFGLIAPVPTLEALFGQSGGGGGGGDGGAGGASATGSGLGASVAGTGSGGRAKVRESGEGCSIASYTPASRMGLAGLLVLALWGARQALSQRRTRAQLR